MAEAKLAVTPRGRMNLRIAEEEIERLREFARRENLDTPQAAARKLIRDGLAASVAEGKAS